MTMLDRMRQHKNWLKWSLALVVLAFVFLYIPAFVPDPGAGALPTDVLADVEGNQITVSQFQREYRRQLQAYRINSGGEVSEELLKQLGIDRQILQQMINDQAAIAEARRLGLTVSDAEVLQQIWALPAFQENGQFIGEQRYRQLLRFQNPPTTPSLFEEDLRRSLLVSKLQAALTYWITISDAELEEEYRRRNEKVKLDVVTFQADDYREEVTVTDEDLAALYTENTADYWIPEKRRIRFVLIDVQAIRDTITVPIEDVQRYYNENIAQYSTPEQVRASHILLRTEGKDEADVRARAEEILAQARAGADFAELAKAHSEDETNAELGGDLDYFGRGTMVAEFEEAAFALEAGTISDPVRTPFGFHLIKVVEKQPQTTRPLAEVSEPITDQLRSEIAQERGDAMAQLIAAQIDGPEDLEPAATARGLEVRESGFAALGEPILGLGPAPEVTTRAFELPEGEVAGPIRTAQGPAFITVTAIQESYIPPLDEVRDRVREDVVRRKAFVAAQEKAAEVRSTLSDAANFKRAAEAAGLEVNTTDLITRGSPLPDLGISPAADAAAFSLSVGATSEPIHTGSSAAIIHLVERQDVTEEQFAEGREALRTDVLAARQNQFFSAYMTEAMQRMNIDINVETLEQLFA